MDRTSEISRAVPRRRRALAAVLAGALAASALVAPSPSEAAGLSLPVQLGQRFIGSASAPKAIPLPLATKIDPIRPLALAGIESTTFAPIKDPVLGITIFSSSEVKSIVRDTISGMGDGTTIGFKVNAIEHPNTAEFTIGGNCIGADGAVTPVCVATVTFKPTTAGAKTDPLKAQITITEGLGEVEASLQRAFNNQGIKGTLVNLIYPLIRSTVQAQLNDGIESALLDPFAVVTATGVAGPFTDPAVFVRRQYADFGAGTPSAAQVTSWVKTFEAGGAPSGFIDTLRKGAAWDGRVGPIARLYSAYFLRTPDTSGLSYWVNRSKAGTRLYAISSTFAASSEFTRRYGSLTDRQFVTLVYKNVLGRSPDSGGLSYWTKQLANGTTRGRLMVGFSESSEYVRKQNPSVITIELWFAMLRRMPNATELSTTSGRLAGGTPVATIIDELLASASYRKRILG